DLRVRLEGDARTRRLRLADDLELRALDAARIALAIDLAATLDLDLEPLGQRVHHAHADAVQAARHLVAALVELAARVQHGHGQLDTRQLLGRMEVHRNAAAVVDDGDRVVGMDRDIDLRAVTG